MKVKCSSLFVSYTLASVWPFLAKFGKPNISIFLLKQRMSCGGTTCLACPFLRCFQTYWVVLRASDCKGYGGLFCPSDFRQAQFHCVFRSLSCWQMNQILLVLMPASIAGICTTKSVFSFISSMLILCKWIFDAIWSMFNIWCHESCLETAAFLFDWVYLWLEGVGAFCSPGFVSLMEILFCVSLIYKCAFRSAWFFYKWKWLVYIWVILLPEKYYNDILALGSCFST